MKRKYLAFRLIHFPYFYRVQFQVISSAPFFNIIHRSTVAEQSPRYKLRLPYFQSPFGPLTLRALFKRNHRSTVCDETIRQGTSTLSHLKHLDIFSSDSLLNTVHGQLQWTRYLIKSKCAQRECAFSRRYAMWLAGRQRRDSVESVELQRCIQRKQDITRSMYWKQHPIAYTSCAVYLSHSAARTLI